LTAPGGDTYAIPKSFTWEKFKGDPTFDNNKGKVRETAWRKATFSINERGRVIERKACPRRGEGFPF
jgi:hypothetical protein